MSMKSVYQILKAIDTSYENQDFNFEKTFDLKKLKISEHRLDLILDNLFDEKYIDFTLKHEFRAFYKAPPREYRLTLRGMDYLENNSSMKQAYKTLKEIKEWIPGM